MAERLHRVAQMTRTHPDLPPALRQIVDEMQTGMNSQLAWYRDLSAPDKEQLDIVAETAIANFVVWLDRTRTDPTNGTGHAARNAREHPPTDQIFFVAPLEFTKSITLNQTVELIRFIVDAMERNVSRFAEPGHEHETADAILYYSREVAFSAASVYALSAQARSDWDARLEALTIADLCDGVTSHQVASRLNLLGWSTDFRCFAISGHMKRHTGDIGLSIARRRIRDIIRSWDGDCLIGEHDTLLTILVSPRRTDGPEPISTPEDYCRAILQFFDERPVCLGPVRSGVEGASYSLRAVLSSQRAATCMSNVPRPLRSDDLLPERVLLGDDDARNELYDTVYRALRGDDARSPLLPTLSAFLRSGSSLDATARELNVHPNTVRYRLKKSVEVTGWDPMNPREAYVLLTAIKVGMMMDSAADGQ